MANSAFTVSQISIPVSLANGGTGTNLSATGGAGQVLQQASSGAIITVGQLSASSLSNGVVGSGAVVLSAKPVTTAADATSITPNTDTAAITYQSNSQSAGTLTINADAGTGQTEGKSWLLKIKSVNIQTFSWNAVYTGGSVALPTASSGSNKTDYYSFIWDSVASKWRFTGNALGF